MCNEKIQGMLFGNVARKLSLKEIKRYSGLVHYLNHHECWNQTPYLLQAA